MNIKWIGTLHLLKSVDVWHLFLSFAFMGDVILVPKMSKDVLLNIVKNFDKTDDFRQS